MHQGIVAVSEEIRKDLIENFRVPQSKVQVIYNLFDHQDIKAKAELAPDPEFEELFSKQVVISVGSLNDLKGFDHLIRGVHHARKNHPDLQLVIIGSGEELDCLRRLVSDLNLDGHVHFLGFQENPYRYLSRADVFVLSSHLEGFPNVLVEAMVCGLPVIATNCKTGPEEIIGASEYGILLEDITEETAANVEREMAKAICMLLEPGKRKKFKELSCTRSADFSKEIITPQWRDVLQSQEMRIQ